MRYVPLDTSEFPCGYVKGLRVTQEHFVVTEASSMERAWLLRKGYRSFGAYTFRPRCTQCGRCVPLRVPVDQFKPSKSQRRAAKRCADVKLICATPHCTEEKYAMYRDHLTRFKRSNEPLSYELFEQSFYDASYPTIECLYSLGDQLIGVGIVGMSSEGLSSVYFFYDRSHEGLSLGTYSLLQEIELTQLYNLPYLYLGYWVRDCPSMRYKADFRPNERLTSEGSWVPFLPDDRDTTDPRWHPADAF